MEQTARVEHGHTGSIGEPVTADVLDALDTRGKGTSVNRWGRGPLTGWLGLALLACLLGAVGAMAATGATASDGAHASSSTSGVRPRRVLVVSLPRLTWGDIVRARPPALLGLLDRSVLASMSVRSVGPRTTLGAGYASIGAGNRAGADAIDEGLAFGAHEGVGTAEASATYAYRTGWNPSSAAVLQLAIPNLIRANTALRYGAVPGSLGSALARAGWNRAVIGNADRSLGPPSAPDRSSASLGGSPPRVASPGAAIGRGNATSATSITLNRPVALALMDQQGRVAGGDVTPGLLRRDEHSPFGLHADDEAFLRAFRREWRPRSTVLVELSDLERADEYAIYQTTGRAADQRRDLLLDADRLLAAMVRNVDPHDLVLVVSPAAPRRFDEPTPFAMSGPGVRGGVTASGTTRRSGYVTLSDVGPTVLDRLGIAQPAEMNGAPISVRGSGRKGLARYEAFVDANRITRFRDRVAGPVSVWFIVFEISGYVIALASLTHLGRRLRPWAALLALTIMAFPTVTFLLGLAPTEGLGYPWFTVVCFVGAVVLARAAQWVGGRLVDRGDLRFGVVPPLLLAGLLWAEQVLDIVTGGRMQIDTVFGYSPSGAGRFAGYGNLAFALVAISSVVVATGIWGLSRMPGRFDGYRLPRAALSIAVGVLAITIVVDGHPALGADVGGVLSLVPTAIVVGIGLSGRRPTWRLLAAIVPATLAALGVFAAIDLMRPAQSRTHLGRLVSSTYAQHGGGFLTVLSRKLAANLGVLTSSVITWLIPLTLVVLVVLAVRPRGLMQHLTDAVPGLRSCLWGASVVAVLGFAFNDSGVSVPIMMFPVLVPYLIHLLVQPDSIPAARTIDSLGHTLARFRPPA